MSHPHCPRDFPRAAPSPAAVSAPLRRGPYLDNILDDVKKLHRRGYSDAQIQRWFENERRLMLTYRQVYYARAVRCELPSNGNRPRFDGLDIRTRRDQNEITRRVRVALLGWGHLLPGVPDEPEPVVAGYDSEDRPVYRTPPPSPTFDLRIMEARILSLLSERRAMTRREIAAALGRRASARPLRTGGSRYLCRLVAAGLVLEWPAVWNRRRTKVYCLAPEIAARQRTRRPDGIDMMLKGDGPK